MSSSLISDTSNLHQRNVERDITTNATLLSKTQNAAVAAAAVPTTEDDEMEPLPSHPSGVSDTPEQSSVQNFMQHFDHLLSGFGPRWRNWIIRGVFSLLMLLGFAKVTSMGPLAISLVILLIQIKCFQEIINIGYMVKV
jgi:hypothetical protein